MERTRATMEEKRKRFAVLCQKIRRKANLNQAQFARALGVSHGALRQWENEESLPSVKTLDKFLAFIGWDLLKYKRYLEGEEFEFEPNLTSAIELAQYDGGVHVGLILTAIDQMEEPRDLVKIARAAVDRIEVLA